MLTRIKKGWEIPESQVTSEAAYMNRREIMKRFGVGAIGGAALAAGTGLGIGAANADTSDLYPARVNGAFTAGDGRQLTSERTATTYNNFYEFGTSKRISRPAQRLTTDPWAIEISGHVRNPMTIDFEDLVRRMPVEERIYRLRCVEAWSMVVPWSGFALRHLVDMASPTSDARYLKMTTFNRPEEARNQGSGSFGFDWPYVEALTIEEARNDLSFMVTGLYGKVLPKQNGAPIRLAVPWKYGFKSIKSIVSFEFVSERPTTFWEAAGPAEYGFWANVNPEVPHRRWSQATERDIETNRRHDTMIYNGYGQWVADMYTNVPAAERPFT